MEDYYLLFEGSIDNRSLSLFYGDEEILSRDSKGDFKRSSFFAEEINEVLKSQNLKLKDLSFLGVGSGPGSYTGLRNLYALLYGMAISSEIPIVQADTLDSLISTIPNEVKFDEVYGCIDARRNEAYCKIYDSNGLIKRELHSLVFDKDLISQLLDSEKAILFMGNFHVKLNETLDVKLNSLDNPIHSRNLKKVARRNFEEKTYLDDSFPSPLYFKSPKITVSRKKLFET